LERTEKYTSKVCFAALCVMVAYAILFATGDFSKWTGSISIWGVTLAVMLLSAVPSALKNIKQLLKNPFMWALAAYALWNVVCLIVGICSGNQMSNIIGDVASLVYFVLLPLLLCILNSKERILKLMHIAVIASLVLGVFTCIVLWCYAIDRTHFSKLYAFLIDSNYINFTFISAKLPRILFVSAPFQLYGCAFSVYFLTHKSKRRALYVASCALSLFSIIMTYTRALYLAAAAAAVLAVGLMLFARKDRWAKTARGVAVSVVGCVAILVCFSLLANTNYFGFALQRVFITGEVTEVPTEPPVTEPPVTEPPVTDPPVTEPPVTEPPVTEPPVTEPPVTEPPVTEPPETEPPATVPPETESPTVPTEPDKKDEYLDATVISDAYRARLKKQMMNILQGAPLTGNGLGTRLPDRKTTPEYSYLDMAIKSGWVGLALYLMPVAMAVFFAIRDLIKKRDVSLTCIWIAALAGQMVYAVFQPYIYSGMAIMLYSMTVAVCSFERRQGVTAEIENDTVISVEANEDMQEEE